MRDCHVVCDLTAHISLQIPSISKSQRDKNCRCALTCLARPPLDLSIFVTAAAVVGASAPPVRGYLGVPTEGRKRFFQEIVIFSLEP